MREFKYRLIKLFWNSEELALDISANLGID